MLHAYLDGSGSHAGSPVFSISGFIASAQQWEEFDQAWNAVLDNPSWPSRLTEFHMVECAHGENEFQKNRWTFANRLALYGELTDVIAIHHVYPVSASVITDCFKRLPPDDLALLQREDTRLGTPLDLVAQLVVQQILFSVADTAGGETVGIMFDEESKAVKEQFQTLCTEYMISFQHGAVFEAFGFGDTRQFTPLQAADLLAYGTIHLVQEKHSDLPYRKPDFPVVPAFMRMLNGTAERLAAVGANQEGRAYDCQSLQALVEKVRNKETLPKRGQ
jgi:hypothetical protein